MNGEPEDIVSIILANPATVSKLAVLDPNDLQIELWHVVAEIADKLYLDALVGTPVPHINALTNAIYPIIAAALVHSARTA